MTNRQRSAPDIAGLAGDALTLAREAGQGTAEGWASESNNLASNVAYHRAGFACNRPWCVNGRRWAGSGSRFG